MEHGLLTVLRIVTNKLKTLLSNAHVVNRTLSDNIDGAQTKTLEAEIMVSKLEACLQRLSSDLNNYFRLNTEPATDEISEITTVQLEAEEMLCELKIRTKGKLQASGSGSKKEERLVSGKLPKLDLPQFNGEIVKWHTFWDQFSSNIHNRNLPDVDKLLYLKASLKGDAKKIIEGLDTTNKNYEIALQTLKERFGKRTHIVDAHYSALYKVKTADNTVIDCRRALDEIERHLQVLESLGEDVNHNHLRFLVTEKFPQDIIYEMRMKTVEESIEEMRKHLKLIITTREEAYRLSQENNPQRIDDFTTETLHTVDRSQRTGPTKQGRGRNNERQEFKTNPRRSQRNFPQDRDSRYLSKREFTPNKATTFDERDRNGDGVPRKRMKMHCIFCNEDHFNDECDKFKTVHERMSLLKDRCISCFRKGHQMKECRIKRICQHCKVFGKHNRALCPQKFVIKTNTLHTNEGGPTILQTAIVTASDGIHSSKGLPCRALMDSGSQRTYITQRVAKELDLQVEEESKLTVFTFGSKSPQEIDSPIVKVMLKTRTGKLISLTANVVPMISHGVPYPTQDFIKWKDNSELADDGSLSDQIDILIGNDYYFSLISSEKIKIQENLYLVRSDLGWILSGKPDSKSDNDLSVVTYFQSCVEVKLNRPDLPLSDGYLKNLWELESIGITDSPKDSREGEAVRTFNETTEFIDNRYHVSWPWIEYPSALSTNLGLAYGRLVTLLRRLDCETLSSYDETLKEQIKNNVVEIVPNIRERPNEHPVHYLPHHGVKQPGKPVRIVYDASSKTKDSKSLNQYLYCGPILLEDLTGLLIRFRCYAIGICADVEKAFLQLALKETDRDVTRFLWLKDIRKPATEDNILHLRFCRVPFGVISSPFLLNATIKMHLGKSGKEHIKELTQNIYVDNVISGARSVKEAMRLYKDAKETFNEISMNLREWSSNSKGVMKQMPDACEDQEVKVLGLKWSLEEDTLQLRHKGADDKSKTKRDVLRVIASIYDPCGCAAPALLPAKLFIQDLWKQKIKWDTHFSEDLNNTWSKIRQDLNGIKEISLPRCYFQNMEKEECQLHCFTDSSTKAYAAVVYLVNDNEISFVIGKSRLVPIKDQDYLKIPRLELLGVLIGCRLVKYVLQFLRLKVTKQVLWTDSQIVIDWYNSDKLLTPFVAKRIEEIRRNKDLIVKYVPSELNPADVATRPNSSKEDKGRWLIGPQFLLDSPNVNTLLTREALPQEKENKGKENPQAETLGMNNQQGMEVEHTEENQEKGTAINSKIESLKKLQTEYFSQELEGKETNLKRNLGLFIDVDGLLRCKGRLKNTDWAYDKCHPILIPKDCDYTNELIVQTHNDNYHVGANHTLSIIRQSFWIPQGKSQVQKIIKKCVRCIKHGGGPFKLPPTPALPPERVKYTSPFTFTGLDYMGPVLVKTENGTGKRWISLFTCLAVRAVHLEVVQDLTAEESLLAMRRMISTRGIPQLVTSDNATNFKLMSEVLSTSYCIKNEIRWRFIPQLAPWYGGFYERLIGIVKNCMKRTLTKHLLNDSQLSTIVKEIEAVVNTRPLTCVDSELVHILKPSDFLTMSRCLTTENTLEEIPIQGTTTKSDLIKSWKRGLTILNEFKDMFSNHYLLSLRERYGHTVKEPRVTSKIIPQEGQIVQIKEDNKNREKWKVGRIVSLTKGVDGLVRVAKIKVDNREYVRSLTHIYPLELEDEDESDYTKINTNNGSNQEKESIPTFELEPMEIEITPKEKVLNEQEGAHEQEEGDEQEQEVEQVSTTRTDESLDKNDDSNVEHASNDEQPKEKELKPRRGAAIRALEKIREWTRNLISLL